MKSIFEPYKTDFYCVELIASQEVRLERNITENRLKNKASKRDLERSRANNIRLDEKYRMISKVGEVPFDHYLRIDNTNIPPEETARMIKDAFGL